MCLCLCVSVFFCRSVLILYPYLQICPCCQSDPRLFSHLISPSFCSSNTLRACLCVFWIIVVKILLIAISAKCWSCSRWITNNLPFRSKSRHKRVKLGSIKSRCTDGRHGTFFPFPLCPTCWGLLPLKDYSSDAYCGG